MGPWKSCILEIYLDCDGKFALSESPFIAEAEIIEQSIIFMTTQPGLL